MHAPNAILGLIVTAALLITPLVEGQDGPFKQLFSKEGQTSQTTKKGNWFAGGPKRVEIDLTKQRLKAYEGNRLVMQTRISSGKNRGTPTGNFKAGPYKSKEHYSSLYHNAPMPYSVQVSGHIFVHGFSVVPDYPASRGCVRVPISGSNPARRFYNWVDVGTPIRIFY